MLDALSDFWKPMKKSAQQDKLQPEQLQIGSTIGFGFVPQPSLSGHRLTVTSVNTYQFGDEALTSFVLTQEKDAGVSMIVAESEGEQYLAISRRIPIGERMKMFDSKDLENIMDNPDTAQLVCKEMPLDFKGWQVSNYKREIQGLNGRIYKGDFRKTPLPAPSQAQEFKYTLLVSESNEHAIEIEKYNDGRVEMYATIYRRVSDIGEIAHPARAELNRPDLKLASVSSEKSAGPITSKSAPSVESKPAAPKEEAKPSAIFSETKPDNAEPIKLQEFPKPVETKPVPEEKKVEVASKPQSQPYVAAPAAPTPVKQEKKTMAMMETAKNGSADNNPKFASITPAAEFKQEVRTVNKTMNGMDSEAIECDLRIANKIIDEAIRNEMRLSDVVRRIIELPVSHQEAVHIPVNLSDEDYALLAIRYGITASDRGAIKKRIFEDLNDFSGGKKKAA
jgi:hypothetical protein